MSEPTIILDKVNEVYLQTSQISISQQLELSEAFKCKAKDFFFSPLFRSGQWNGDLHFYNKSTRQFPIGLLSFFIKFCKKFNYSYKFNFDVSDLKCEISDEDIEKFYQHIFKNSFKPRDYQDFAIKKALRNKRGIIEHATGLGKSLSIYVLIRFILATTNKKILLIVPTINLVKQMFNDFKEYGWDSCSSYISLIYGTSTKKDWDNPIIISTWQSLYKKSEEFFKNFGMVIVDETHHAKSASIKSILAKCVNADYRIGLTGSLQDKNDKNELADFLTITGYLGPVIARETMIDGINKGYLSDFVIANLILKYPDNLIELTKFDSYNYLQEIEIIQSYSKRNKILDYILNHIKNDENVLILCHEVEEHLKVVANYLRENFKNWKLNIIHGRVSIEKREEIRQNVNKTSGNILLATYGTLSTGINIPRLHHIIFFSSYKSKIKIIQSLGRGLRKHETKRRLIVYDIIDDLTYTSYRAGKEIKHKNYVYDHWLKRLKYYSSLGFKFINKRIDLEKL